MKKADIILSLLTGLVVAWLGYSMLGDLDLSQILGMDVKMLEISLFFVFPILALLGLWISYLIGRKFPFVYQLAKFLLIGALATMLDLGILNVLITFSGLAAGLAFTVFKAISFIGATFAKYWGNKFLAFEKKEMEGAKKEFAQFFLITFIGLGLNVGIASFIVNVIGPQIGMSLKMWANVAAITAALLGFAWNFLGYKFIVFKK